MLKLIVRGLFLLSCVIMLPAVSCPSSGCGSTLLTILAKVGPDKQIGDLDTCDWKTLFHNLPSLAELFNVDLQGASTDITDSQAQAIVDFLDAHNIDTVDQLFNAIETGVIQESDIPPDLLELVPDYILNSSSNP